MLDILKKIKDPILSDSTNIMGGGTLIEQEKYLKGYFLQSNIKDRRNSAITFACVQWVPLTVT